MSKTKKINLALQGGGAHGAFTWGVLDYLLDCPEIEIAAITGTSAGALNGAALKAGLVDGSREAAKQNLEWLWDQVTGIADLRMATWFAPFAPPTAQIAQFLELSPGFQLAEATRQIASPYAFGPLYKNPLEPVVSALSYEKVCSKEGPQFFVSATNVRTGKIRVFSGKEIGTPVILASACLPTLFQAVEFEDPESKTREAFWDGGYTGNPALFPLYTPELPNDVVVVNINPLYRPDVPRTAADIQNRINEISFNSSLLRELRAVNFVKELIAEDRMPKGAMKDVYVHMIADDDLMRDLSVATKTVPSPVVISRLREAGRRAAHTFLDTHFDTIGVDGTVDLQKMFT